jgi:hypothetical protein
MQSNHIQNIVANLAPKHFRQEVLDAVKEIQQTPDLWGNPRFTPIVKDIMEMMHLINQQKIQNIRVLTLEDIEDAYERQTVRLAREAEEYRQFCMAANWVDHRHNAP